jgi:hypothetical protein
MSRCRRTDAIAEIVADPALGVDALTEDQWAHVGICADCHSTVRGLERLDLALAASLRAGSHEDLPPSVLATPELGRRPARAPIGALMAAAAVVIVAVGLAAVGADWLMARGIGADPSLSTSPPSQSAAPTRGPESTSRPSPQGTPTPTAEPSPAATVEPGPIGLAVGQVAAVVDEPLVVRTAPGTDPDSTITPDRLWLGQRVRILDGPADVDGYTWWEVQVGEVRGWVADAEADGSAPWLAPVGNGQIHFWRYPGEGDVAMAAELYRVEPDGSGETRIGSPSASGMRLVISCGSSAGPIQWSHDGAVAVFDHSEGGCDQSVFSMRADGSEIRKVGDGWAPAWRPDGGAIAFGPNAAYLAAPEPGHGRLLVAEDGGAAAPIGDATSRTLDGAPAWSPDRKRLAYQKALAGQDDAAVWTYEVWVMDADGSDARRLTPGLWPRWSPDGRWIVYEVPVDDIGTTELWRIRPEDDEPESLGPGRMARFSPDGDRIAVVRDHGVWVMNADGTDAALAISATLVDGLAWSPDGSSLVVSSDHPDSSSIGISIVRLDGAAPAITGLVTPGHAPSWQPLLLDPRLAD